MSDLFELEQEELKQPIEEIEEILVFEVNENESVEFLEEIEDEPEDPKDTPLTNQDFDQTYRPDYELEIHLPDLKYEEEGVVLSKTIEGMARLITNENYFITDKFSRELYYFQEFGSKAGTYIEAGDSIESAVRQVAKQFKTESFWTKRTKRRDLYDWINNGLRELEDPDIRHINVMNGLIILAPGGSFISHSPNWSPDYLTTVKLPIYYDANAKCPAWEKFVSQIFPEDSVHIAWEIAALLMVPFKNKAASAIILKGPKNSGKSTFQNALISFLGKSNVSNLSLERFGERFQDVQLKGKLANIVGELPQDRLNAKAVNTIKQLIGNDLLAGEIKNGANFMFQSYARCLFSCNSMPTCTSDEAFFDRFHIIPFNRQFSKNPEKELELNALLSSPEELSGLFNKALEALPKVMSEGIIASASMKAVLSEVIEENDTLIGWSKEYLEFDENASMLNTDLHDNYISKEPSDYARKSLTKFVRDLKGILPNYVQVKQKMINGTRSRYFVGVRLIDNIEAEFINGAIDLDGELGDIEIKPVRIN